MGKEDLLISIISLAVLFIFVFNPILRKILKQVDKEKSTRPPREDPSYSSIDTFSQRILNSNEQMKPYRIVQPEIVYPAAVEIKNKKNSAMDRIQKQSALRKAVIWKEILSAPVSLKDSDSYY